MFSRLYVEVIVESLLLAYRLDFLGARAECALAAIRYQGQLRNDLDQWILSRIGLFAAAFNGCNGRIMMKIHNGFVAVFATLLRGCL
jgi:hypothetical protein